MRTIDTKRKIIIYIQFIILLLILGWIFYRSIYFSLALTPIAILMYKKRVKKINNNNLNEINFQFRELLYSISSSLRAGKSLEMAFKESLNDLKVLYPNSNALIIKEVDKINRKIEMNISIEDALDDFATSYNFEAISSFSDIIKTCRRTGADLITIVKRSSDIISERITIKQEINIIMAQKVFENKILTLLPVILIFVLSISAYDFIKPVYETLFGRFIMSLALIFIFISNEISEKIMDIKV